MATTQKHILLMTATITPENSPLLVRTDPVQRLHDYERALEFYVGSIGKPLYGIVFVENSDSDISSLRAIADRFGVSDRIEFVANYGKQSYPGRDRAYGEFKLLDYAMANSALVAGARDEAVIWKITGRYLVLNLATMIRSAPKRFDVYVDMRNHPLRWMDLRFMGWTYIGYDRVFAGLTDKIEAEPNEPVMREYVPTLSDKALIVQRFRSTPLVDGIRGWDNRQYFSGGAKVKHYVRVVARMLAPWYWI